MRYCNLESVISAKLGSREEPMLLTMRASLMSFARPTWMGLPLVVQGRFLRVQRRIFVAAQTHHSASHPRSCALRTTRPESDCKSRQAPILACGIVAKTRQQNTAGSQWRQRETAFWIPVQQADADAHHREAMDKVRRAV
eukprot:scaffold273_cov242-Pinguiococcus_pyrenoidosus.AAC.47